MKSSRDMLLQIEEGRDSKSSHNNKTEINILFIDLTTYSTFTQFTCCCFFVFVFYLSYGYFLELIFTDINLKPISLYITLVQFFLTMLLSYIESLIRSNVQRQAPLKLYMGLAALTLGTMTFSNLSLNYLNYPTQLIFKSCKLIPVMIGSIIIQGKKYGFLDYSAAVLMCVGLTMFTLADSKASPNFDVLGIIIISFALLCDAVIGNVQEKAMKQYQISNNEMVFYSYGIAFAYLEIFTLCNGVLLEGFALCLKNPLVIYGNIFMLSISGYLGLQAVLSLLRICGAPITVTVTTMRKALSMIFSFLLFSKPFVFQYVWSGMLVVIAIYLNLYSKKHPNYVPGPILLCWNCIKSLYKYEYRYIRIRTKIHSDTV